MLLQVSDRINAFIGRMVAWFALALVIIEFAIVVLRYAGGVSLIWLGEGAIYIHALMFMLAIAYTLQQDAHVRVDVFYGTASPRKKAMIDLVGVVLFLLPMCAALLIYSVPYALQSWRIVEGSAEVSGLPGLFILKSAIPLMAVMTALQGLSMAARSWALLGGGANRDV